MRTAAEPHAPVHGDHHQKVTEQLAHQTDRTIGVELHGDALSRKAASLDSEEADLRADDWHVLVDFFNSPGGSTESFRCYLARGLHAVPEEERHARQGEERDMATAWVSLDDARDLVLGGRLHNPTAVSGIFAACAARDAGWSTLRPPDAPWPERSPGR